MGKGLGKVYFRLGCIFMLAMYSLCLDIFFEDAQGYAEYVMRTWIERKISLPMAILVLVIISIKLLALHGERIRREHPVTTELDEEDL